MNITLDLRPGIEDGVYKLRDTISRLGPDAEMTIILGAMDAQSTGKLVEELRNHGFDYFSKVSNRMPYNIIAKRHLLQ
ncbi:hypothetical protein [Phosphitispora sp. TUW77]|uniref:hypothetical protein n=1 Tax=Phosphitispora sp. TUW77 TaxID=3152361 RepID=UPI003AB45463